MKIRTVVLLAGLLVLLGLVAWVTDRAEDKRLAPAAGGKLLPKLDASKATKVVVTAKGVTDTLMLKGTSWRLTDQDLPADDDRIRAALKKLESLTRSELASENPEKHETLEVKDDQEAAVTVAVWASDAKEPVADLVIGKTGSDFQSNFVRVKGEDQVYRSSDLIRSTFEAGPAGWGNLNVAKFEPDEAVKVELQTFDGGTVALERQGAADPWKMTLPVAGPADATLVEQIVGTLSFLRADRFAGLSDAFTTGLDKPARSTVTLKDGKTVEVRWGKEAPDNGIYVEAKDGEIAYIVPAARMTAVFPELAKLRGPEPAAPTASSPAPVAVAPTAPGTEAPEPTP